jgi:ribosomal-protein-alanine N-acetyltransferase
LVTLRPASVSDLTALGDIEQQCMGPEAWSRAALAAELVAAEQAVPSTRYAVVAERPGGVVVGYAVLLVVATAADVLRVAVAPAHRRSGVGRALLADLLAEAGRRGCDETLLEVDATNPAATAMYRAAGFTEIGRRPRYYAAGTDASIMRLPL